MNPVERYIGDVLRYIPTPPQARKRIESDLRAHFQEALARGEPLEVTLSRIGNPKEVAEAFMSGVKLRYAGFWPRLAAFAIDVAAIVALALPLMALAILLSVLVPREPQGWDYVVGAVLIAAIIGAGLAAIGVALLYFPILEARFGQTLGKRTLKLRVVKESGIAIGYKEAFLRRLPYYFDFILLDALFIPFTARRQRAFDIIARTVVIHETPAEPTGKTDSR